MYSWYNMGSHSVFIIEWKITATEECYLSQHHISEAGKKFLSSKRRLVCLDIETLTNEIWDNRYSQVGIQGAHMSAQNSIPASKFMKWLMRDMQYTLPGMIIMFIYGRLFA